MPWNLGSPTFSGQGFNVPSSSRALSFGLLRSVFAAMVCKYKYTATNIWVKCPSCAHHRCRRRCSVDGFASGADLDFLVRRNFFTVAAEFTLRSLGPLRPAWRRRSATSCASSIRSATRATARRFPMAIAGSGATTSVHCGGMEQTVLASTCNRSRLPYRLYRSPTQANCRPLSGWNGCVTRTRCAVPAGASALRIELQAIVDREISVLARPGRRGEARVARARARRVARRWRSLSHRGRAPVAAGVGRRDGVTSHLRSA